jgi:hypothetical protein
MYIRRLGGALNDCYCGEPAVHLYRHSVASIGLFADFGKKTFLDAGRHGTHRPPCPPPATRAPPLPTVAERHTVQRLPALLVCTGMNALAIRTLPANQAGCR